MSSSVGEADLGGDHPIVESFHHSMKVEHKLTMEHLTTLMEAFDGVEAQKHGLDMVQFSAAITGRLAEVTQEQLALLFMKIDTSCDGRVDWNEFCSYMMLEYEKNQPQERGLLINDQVQSKPMQVHRDPVVHSAFAPPKKWHDASRANQLVTIDSGGMVCKWNSEYTSCRKIHLELPASRPQVASVKVLPSLNRIVVSLMNRTLRLFELSCASGMVCEISGLEHSVLSIDTVLDDDDKTLTMLLGDLGGFVTHLVFTEAKATLFGEGVVDVRYRDLLAGVFAPKATVESRRKVHDDWATKVMCCNSRGLYVSCCSANRASLVLGDKAGVISEFNVAKGVRVFDVNSGFNSIVTGGQDYAVRVWDKYVTARPCAVLDGHVAPICGVVLSVSTSNEKQNFETAASPHDLDGHQARVISVSIDHVLKVWDVSSQVCLQTVMMHGLPRQSRLPPQSLLVNAERGVMFIGSSTLLHYRLMDRKPPQVSDSLSHNCPVSSARFNPLFGQVVTACRGSVVNVWNMKTGEQMVQFRDAHGDAEVTTLGFDRSSRRLLTGASDGSVKVWNFNIGLCLRKLQNVETTEVSGIVELKNRAIITAGWWRKLSYFRHDDDHHLLHPEKSIQGVGHAEDVQHLEHCGGNVVATCSYDGVIIIWQIDPLSIKRKVQMETASAHPGTPTAVEKLQFLDARCRSLGGTLVSGGSGGWIRFWNIYSGNLVGAFQINSRCAVHRNTSKTLSVSALATSNTNDVMVTGDSAGEMKIWNIADYCCKQSVEAGTPPLLHGWTAHAGAIVSLQVIEQEIQPPVTTRGSHPPPPCMLRMVLSASADKTVRLWTLDGTAIGTFGQHEPWDIADAKTYGRAHHTRSLGGGVNGGGGGLLPRLPH
jgi:WD40 repeat protein